MNQTDLQKTLRAVEPAAVLVEPRVLENIVRQSWNLSSVFWAVPHRSNFIVDRQTLYRHVNQEDLDLGPDEILPSPVILLARPSNESLAKVSSETTLLQYWQEMFHASVHLSLEGLWNEHKLNQAELRTRIGEIGQTEFEEIKNVLIQDDYLPDHADERTVYMEFAAVFLEQYYFSRGLLDGTFPGLRDKEAVRLVLERDVNGGVLFNRTRLKGAADPIVLTVSPSQEAHEFYEKLKESSEQALKKGNLVLSAIQKQKASRVAPPDLGKKTVEAAHEVIRRLAERLKGALGLDDAGAAEWQAVLVTLLDKADQGTRPAEAAMLYDLQKVCLDHEQDIYALDLVEWIRSLGRRPIKRPLKKQRLVRLTRDLRSAAQRLTMARLSDDDRKHLGDLFQAAQKNCENRLREDFRPVLATAMEDVGLKPRNPPERAAFDKMIEELIDRVLIYGFLTFSDLRDTLSRNLLKLPDLADPEDVIYGDSLINLDRRLTTPLDGVYRRAEFYLRWLERFTSLFFGTKIGRSFTRYVAIPFGAAFLILACIDRFILQPFSNFSIIAQGQHPVFSWSQFTWIFLPFWLPLSLVILALLYIPKVHHISAHAAGAVWQAVRTTLLIEGPLWLIRNPALKRFFKTWTFRLFYWYLLKPVVVCALLWLITLPWPFHEKLNDPFVAAMLFFTVNFLLNIRPVETVSQTVSRTFVHVLEDIRAGLLLRIVNFVIGSFKTLMHWAESLLNYVDDWLRFREEDSEFSTVSRGILTGLWFPISYLARFNMVVFIEPCLNPLKFPICSIAFKFYLPFYYVIPNYLSQFGPIAEGIGFWITFWFADVFGFFFWEIRENWSMYRANRSETLKPMIMGPHGETLPALLRPGFHSGTVPKLFARLRKAERGAHRTGNWKAVRSCQAELDSVKESVRQFLTRNFIALLSQHPHWHGVGLTVGKVSLATNQIRAELVVARETASNGPAVLEFEYRAAWLLAGFDSVGWLTHLTPLQIQPLHNALAMLYKLAGVDIVREQFQAALPTLASVAELTPEGLAFRLDGRPLPAIVYDLQIPAESIAPQPTPGSSAEGWPVLNENQILFRTVPVTWKDCVDSWSIDPARPEPLMLARDVALLPNERPGALKGDEIQVLSRDKPITLRGDEVAEKIDN